MLARKKEGDFTEMATEFNTDSIEAEGLSDNRALVRTIPPDGDGASNPSKQTDFRNQAQQYKQQAVDTLNRAKAQAGEYIGQANEKFKDLQNKDLNEIAEEAKDFARRKPVQAMAITAAAGLVLGLILRGGRR